MQTSSKMMQINRKMDDGMITANNSTEENPLGSIRTDMTVEVAMASGDDILYINAYVMVEHKINP